MPFSGSIEDRLFIRELYDRYGDASWRGDREAWLECFTEEGRWVSHLFDCRGRDELIKTWDGLWKDWAHVAFLHTLGSLEVAGARATARSYAREIVQLKTGGLIKLAGQYDDELVRRSGEWLFASRVYTVMIAELPREASTASQSDD